MKTNCGIYEIVAKSGRKSYKIFTSIEDLEKYLAKNKDKTCDPKEPVYQREHYKEFSQTQIRKLTQIEVETYLKQQLS